MFDTWRSKGTNVASLRRLSSLLVCLAFVLTWIAPKQEIATAQEAGKANAAEFSSYAVSDVMKTSYKEKKRLKDEMLRGTTAFNKQEVFAYYRGYLLPMLTFVGKPELGNNARREMVDDIDRAEKANENVMSEFNSMVFDEMKKLVEGNFQPSAGIIATQLLGKLNKTRARGSLAAEPYGPSTPLLFNLLRNGKSDGIRAAALAGFERHIDVLQGAWDDRTKQGIADALLASLKSPKPATRDDRADAWLRGRTIELLLKIKHSKESELYQFATNALADSQTNPLLMEKAMLVTGQYPVSPTEPATVYPILSNSLKLLVNRVNDWKNEVGMAQHQAYGGDADGGDMTTEDDSMTEDVGGDDEGGMRKAKKREVNKSNPFAKQSADVIAKRRALHETLELIRFGFTGSRFGTLPTQANSGLALLVPEGENRQIIDEIMMALKDLQDAINSTTITDRTRLVSEATPKVDTLLSAIEFYLSGEPMPVQPVPGEPMTPAPASADVTVTP